MTKKTRAKRTATRPATKKTTRAATKKAARKTPGATSKRRLAKPKPARTAGASRATNHAKAAKTAKPSKAAKPARTARTARPRGAAEPMKSAKRSGAARTAKPAAAAKPGKAAKPAAAAKPGKAAKPSAAAKSGKAAVPMRRRDGSGHLDPTYAATLREKSREGRTRDPQDAFIGGHARSSDTLAEEMGETWVETATSGEDGNEDVFNQEVPEETGGPFVTTSGRQEFAEGTDASNPRGSKREPFPRT